MISPFLTRTITRPRKPSPAEDPQRHEVYKMEREFIGQTVHTYADHEHLREVVMHACRYYGVKPPLLKFTNKPKDRTFGWSESDKRSISLNVGFHGDNMHTLIHELAHHIVDHVADDNVAAHGPEFLAIYAHLKGKYRLVPEDAFRLVCERRGLEISDKYLPEHFA